MVSEACHGEEIVSVREEWGRGLLRAHRASGLPLHPDRNTALCVSIAVCRCPLSPTQCWSSQLLFSGPFVLCLLSPPRLLPSPTLFSSFSFALPCLSLSLHPSTSILLFLSSLLFFLPSFLTFYLSISSLLCVIHVICF